jgi:hypothetical protein
VTELLRLFLGSLNHGLHPLNGRPARAGIAGNLVAGVPGIRLDIRRGGEVHPCPLPGTGVSAFGRLDGTFERDDLAREQILADEVFCADAENRQCRSKIPESQHS